MACMDPVLHLVRTACLVESRAPYYSGYLASVFRRRGWAHTFQRWGEEEGTHGVALRGWLSRHDPGFDFEATFARYLAEVPYHREDEGSYYGSEQRELVARCFVEAMAATYYQAVGAAAVGRPELQALCHRLAADEARHYALFRRLLEQLREAQGTQRLEAMQVVWQRLTALQDEQLVYASWLVGGAHGTFDLAVEGRRYRAMMVSLYRPAQVRFVGTLVAQVLGAPRPPRWVDPLSAVALRLISAAS